MPNNIVPYESQISPLTAIPDTRATPADMGAGIGQAIAGIGSDIDSFRQAVQQHQDREDGINAQLALAQARQDMTQHLIQMENSPLAGSSGFTDHFTQAFDDYQAKATNALPDNPRVQNAFKVGMADLRAGLADRAMQSQATQGAALGAQKAQATLSTYVNTIATDPTQYDDAVKAGNAAVDGLNLPPLDAAKLKSDFSSMAVAARFDTMFRAAKTPAAIQGVIDDLANGPWKDKMSAESFRTLLTFANSEKNSVQKSINEQAGAAVTDIEQRVKDGVAIDPNEMAQVEAQVKQSTSPIVQDRFVRLQVQGDATQRAKVLSTPALTGFITTIKQGSDEPMAATPNSPTGRAQDGFSYLKSKYGLDDVAALGILANAGRETGFVPRPGDGGTSDGYFQWHNERMTAAAAAGATGTDIRKAIDFAMSEPEGQQYLAMVKSGAIRTPQQAAQAWLQVFEKPADPTRDAGVNAQWIDRLSRAIGGGRPLTASGPQGDQTAPGSGYMSEGDWIRAKAAEQVLKRRDEMVRQGDQMDAAQDAGLFTLGKLDTPQDFQTRGQQAERAQGFLNTPESKPFTPQEQNAFAQVMQAGTIEQKTQLLQNVASMGASSPAAFKQIGEKSPVFAHIGGLNAGSPQVAQDVLRGVQAIQDNPDLKEALTSKGTGTPGGTPAAFQAIAGQAMINNPQAAYAARQAADALYVQRTGPGAKWDAGAYEQAVRDVLGGKPGDAQGGVTTINGQQTILPPGVNAEDFNTMVHSLTYQDLAQHSIGGGIPYTLDRTTGKSAPISPAEIANEGKWQAVGAGAYRISLANGAPALGTAPSGIFTFRIDAAGVQAIVNRDPQQPRTSTEQNILNDLGVVGDQSLQSGNPGNSGQPPARGGLVGKIDQVIEGIPGAVVTAGKGIATGLHAMSHSADTSLPPEPPETIPPAPPFNPGRGGRVR